MAPAVEPPTTDDDGPADDLRAAATALHSAAIHLLRTVRTADAATGLSPARLSILSVLVFAGPRTIGELAAAEQVRSPTITGLVDGLAADGLVRRRSDPDDRRLARVAATPRGRRLLLRARDARVERLVELLRGVAPGDVATIARAAALVEERVAAAGPPP